MPSLLILPTTDLVDDSARAVLPDGAEVAASFSSAMTFADLEETLLQSALAGRQRLPAGGRRLALDAILASATERSDPDADYRGWTSRAVEALLLELVAGGADPEQLESVAPRLKPPLRARVVAVSRFVRSYLNRLKERNLGDSDLSIIDTCKSLESGGEVPSRLAAFDAIEFRHILDWRPGRVRIARALAGALKGKAKVVVRLPRSERDDVREALAPVYESIESAESDLEVVHGETIDGTGREVRAVDAADEVGESREVARRVRDLINGGTALDSIALATTGARKASPRFVEALADLGIPAGVREGEGLAHTLVARLALNFADWGPPDELTRERMCALISCGAIQLNQFVDGGDAHPLEIVRHVRAAAVRSRLKDRAGDGFSGRLERLARSFDSAKKHDEAERVRNSVRVLQKFFARVDDRPLHATLPVHAKALCKLLTDLGVEKWAMETSDDSGALEQAAWNRLSEEARGLEETATLLSLRDRPVSRDAFSDWPKNLFDGASRRPGTTRGAAVEFLELGDLAGRKFEHVFIVAASDDRLPSRVERQSAFSEDECRQLNTALGRPVFSVTPGGAAASLDAAAFALATNTSDHITISRARADGRGRPLADTQLLALISAHPIRERIAFAPLNPILGNRSSPSIQARRDVAKSRAAFFRGESEAGPFGGDIHELAAMIQPLAAGTRDHLWSASALERLATCSFRYLADWAWRAKEEDEPADVAGPMEVGRLAHLGAEHAVKAMLEARAWSSSNSDALNIGLEAATRVVAEAERATVLGHPELWELSRKQMLDRLRLLLDKEIHRTESDGVLPVGLELSFGLKGAPLDAFEIAGVFVGGQVDRVDVGPTSALVLDYKSGRTDYNRHRLSEGELFEVQLQLPLYAVALSHLMPEARGLDMDATYVSLRDLRRTKTVRDALKGATFDEVKERLEQTIESVTSHIREGRFPVAPHACHGCHLQPVCRIPRKVDA